MTRDYAAIATDFQARVLAGTHPCSRITRSAFVRQARMLANPPAGYRWDPSYGERLCGFVEALTFPVGQRTGQPIDLLPWQVWLYMTAESWRHVETAAPMFRRDLLFITKSHGKGVLLAGWGLATLAYGNASELVLTAGVTRDQAGDCFRMARSMVQQDTTGALARDFGLVASKNIIEGRGDARQMHPVSSEGRGVVGKAPSLAILDELAQHATRDMYDQIFPSMVKNPSMRMVVLSNAGFDQSPQAPGWEAYQQARDILQGKDEDPSVFAFLLEADPELPWDAEATWRQCNWNIGNGVDLPALVSEARAARKSSDLKSRFVTMHCGWWAAAPRGLIAPEQWRAGTIPDLTVEQTVREWPEASWWIGVDPALGGHTGTDICSIVALAARLRTDGEREYRAHTRLAYLNTLSKTWEATPALEKWADEGWLTRVDGESIPTSLVSGAVITLADDLQELGADLQAVVVDKSYVQNVLEKLNDKGLTVIDQDQGARDLHHGTTQLDQAIVGGRFFHDESPLAEWMAANVEVRPNIKGHICPLKKNRNESNKIDVIAAIVDAMGQASIQSLNPPFDPSAPAREAVPRVIHLPSPLNLGGGADPDDEDW